MSTTRQLAAIMFTDIEGYTSLMQSDEQKAIEIRTKHRKIFNSTTEKFNGRILQYYGDGTLSIFDSAIDAVKCAIEMQKGFLDDPAIPIRIGIHTGDIIYNEEEIIGDGVNVAARIEALSKPGSIFISEKVHDDIKNQSDIKSSFIRSFQLKNIQHPVKVYAIANPGINVPDVKAISNKSSEKFPEKQSKKSKLITYSISAVLVLALALLGYPKYNDLVDFYSEGKENSIAVLAFEDMSPDADQEYFSDGISEEILNSLVTVKGLNVAGRNSGFSFKGQNVDIQKIGEKLNVNLVLEGSVRKMGDRVRITAQLINVEDGFHIWSETYDRELKDIFTVQKEIADRISKKLQLHVHQETIEPYEPKMEAYDLVLKGKYFLERDFEGAEKALTYFQEAVQIDSNYAHAFALMSEAYVNFAIYDIMPPKEAFSLAKEAAYKALDLNPSEFHARKFLAYSHLHYDFDWQQALQQYELAVEHGLPEPDHFISIYDIFLYEDYETAIQNAKKVLSRDPLSMQHNWHVGFCYYFASDYNQAITYFNNAIELDPNYSEGYRWKGKALMDLGKFDDAIRMFEKALLLTGGKGPAQLELMAAKILNGVSEEMRTQLDYIIDKNPQIDPMGPALLYTLLDEKSLAIKWLEKGYEAHSLSLITLKNSSIWDPQRTDPKFQAIYENMNFPKTASRQESLQ